MVLLRRQYRHRLRSDWNTLSYHCSLINYRCTNEQFAYSVHLYGKWRAVDFLWTVETPCSLSSLQTSHLVCSVNSEPQVSTHVWLLCDYTAQCVQLKLISNGWWTPEMVLCCIMKSPKEMIHQHRAVHDGGHDWTTTATTLITWLHILFCKKRFFAWDFKHL